MKIEAGVLVTDARAPVGSPTWVGVMVTESGFFELGYPIDADKGRRELRYSGPKRALTDDEKLSVAAWLITGDPEAEWEVWADVAWVLSPNNDDEPALWSNDDGWWSVYVEGWRESVASGMAPTDRERRVAASRAFIAYLCREF